MKFYKIDDQVVISDKALSAGTELIPNTTDAAGETTYSQGQTGER